MTRLVDTTDNSSCAIRTQGRHSTSRTTPRPWSTKGLGDSCGSRATQSRAARFAYPGHARDRRTLPGGLSVGVPVARRRCTPLLAVRSRRRGCPACLVSFHRASSTSRYKGYSVMVHERNGLSSPGPVWNRTCLFCHNTVPYLDSLLGALAGPRAPQNTREKVVDALLSGAPRIGSTVTTDAPELASGLSRQKPSAAPGANYSTHERDGKTGSGLRRAASMRPAIRLLPDASLLEVGIGCESVPRGEPRARRETVSVFPFVRARRALSRRSYRTAAACRAHARRTREPRVRPLPPGSVFALPVHMGRGRQETRHAGGKRDQLRRGAGLSSRGVLGGNDVHRLPRSTHQRRARPPGTARDSRRQSRVFGLSRQASSRPPRRPSRRILITTQKGTQGSCIAYHVPKKNMSLDTDMTRYHRIGITEQTRFACSPDRPLECALCHADKQVARARRDPWRHGGTRRMTREALRALRRRPGGQRPLLATLERDEASRAWHSRSYRAPLLSRRALRVNVGRATSGPSSHGSWTIGDATRPRVCPRFALLRALGEVDGRPAPPCELTMYAGQGMPPRERRRCAQTLAGIPCAGLPLPTWQGEAGPAPASPMRDSVETQGRSRAIRRKTSPSVVGGHVGGSEAGG